MAFRLFGSKLSSDRCWIFANCTVESIVSRIWIIIHYFSFTKTNLKMPSAKCYTFCLGLNMLPLSFDYLIIVDTHRRQWTDLALLQVMVRFLFSTKSSSEDGADWFPVGSLVIHFKTVASKYHNFNWRKYIGKCRLQYVSNKRMDAGIQTEQPNSLHHNTRYYQVKWIRCMVIVDKIQMDGKQDAIFCLGILIWDNYGLHEWIYSALQPLLLQFYDVQFAVCSFNYDRYSKLTPYNC